jgi:hypothetical protein
MSMQFNPDRRLIDLMVGQLFYNSPDVAIRELMQNAEDACSLQRVIDPQYEAKIIIRYSIRENSLEVIDNGLGMNHEAIEKSFAAVGASKENVSHIQNLLSKSRDAAQQIAYFGVGILSCFGVAQNMIVRTKMDEYSGLSFDIPNYHEQFIIRPDPPEVRGTRIWLKLKDGGPLRADQVSAAVQKYARHALHVQLENEDTGESHPVSEQWIVPDLSESIEVADAMVRKGFVALHPTWNQAGTPLQSSLLLCNGGFLAREKEPNLLVSGTLGYLAEIDLKPGELTIQLNREGFVQDDKWRELQRRLTEVYLNLIRSKINGWTKLVSSDGKATPHPEIEQGVLMLARGPTRGILPTDLQKQIDALVPLVLQIKQWGDSKPFPASELLVMAKSLGAIYYIRQDQAPRQFQHNLQQGAGNVQVTEHAQTEEIRARHLQAKGAIVITCRQRNYTYEMGGANQALSLHEADAMGQLCQESGIRFVEVISASSEDVALAGAPESYVFSSLLDWGEELKIVSLPTQDRVLRDFAGRLLNSRHPEVQEVLKTLPDAVGNPVRRMLLQIYIDLEVYRFSEARRKTKELLTMTNLSEQAQLKTGQFLREFLSAKMQKILGPDHE